MSFNSKDILGALFCCALLVIGLSLLAPGLGYSGHPPLTGDVTDESVRPIDADLGPIAAGSALPGADSSPVSSADISFVPGKAAMSAPSGADAGPGAAGAHVPGIAGNAGAFDPNAADVAVSSAAGAAGASAPDTASSQTTYSQDADPGSDPSAAASAPILLPDDAKDLIPTSKGTPNTAAKESAGSSSKPVVKKSEPTPNTQSNKPKSQPVSGSRVGELISWSKASQVFAMYDRALITDVDSGLSFWVQRRGGSKHADCQPLTAADTAVMKKIYGGQWSWERKAIVVTVKGKHLAASMNGMPHMAGAITNNNFNGHFCIHFQDSRTHGTNRPDPAHQSMVLKAAGK